ncbi:MAG: type II toxin-antitoxin system RelE/ParE family toxin [Candidatus Methylomirabilaceae bacterium]
MPVSAYLSMPLTPVHWMGSSLVDLRACPERVQDAVGYALFLAQIGKQHPATKWLRGDLHGLVEVVEDHDGSTYRAVYTTKLAGLVYVLHVFQKKSTHGIATPKRDLDLIKARLRRAREHHAAHVDKET